MRYPRRQWVWLCPNCGGDRDPCSPDVRCIRCARTASGIYDLTATEAPALVHFWACPQCLGDIESSQDSERIRCVSCRNTEAQWAHRYPRNEAIRSTVYPDAYYVRDYSDDGFDSDD